MIWATIIAAITAVGSSVIAGGMQIKENQRAREEARGLAEQTRGDVLDQRNFSNMMTNRQLQFDQKKLNHNEFLTDEHIASSERGKQQAIDDRRKNQITQSVQAFDEQKDDMLEGRAIARRRFM